MHLSDSGWTIIKIVEQMDIDRRHISMSPEFSMSDRLKAHLISRNKSVFETLFNQFHDPKMAALNIKIDDGCPEHRQVLGSIGFLTES